MKHSVKMANTLGNHGSLRIPYCNAGGYVQCTDNMADFAFGITSSNSAVAGAKAGTGYFTIEWWVRALVPDQSGTSGTGHNFSGSWAAGFGDTGLSNSNGRIGMYFDRNRPSVQTSGLTGNPFMNPDVSNNGSLHMTRTMVPGRWYHMAFVCDGNSTKNYRLYVNGYLYNYFAATTPTFGQPSSFSIGGYYVGNTACDWDDFRVYKGACLYGSSSDTISTPAASGFNLSSVSSTTVTLSTTSHGLVVGDSVSTATGMGSWAAYTQYYVLSVAGANITVSNAWDSVSAVSFTAGSGTIAIIKTGSYIGTSVGGTAASGYTLPTKGQPISASGYESYMVADVGFNNNLIDRTSRHTWAPVTNAGQTTLYGTSYTTSTTATSYNGAGILTCTTSSQMSAGLPVTLSAALGGFDTTKVLYIATVGSGQITLQTYRDGSGPALPSGSGTTTVTAYFGYYQPSQEKAVFTADRY